MNKEYKQLWIDALRSGKYPQTSGSLQDNVGYCCLGVVCEVLKQKGIGEWDDKRFAIGGYKSSSLLPPAAAKELGTEIYPDGEQLQDFKVTVEGREFYLAVLNDRGYTFAQIADLIEEQL